MNSHPAHANTHPAQANDHDSLRACLETDRDRLRTRHLATEATLRAGVDNEPDILDRGTLREDDTVIEALDASDVDKLALIEAALSRLDLGTFGNCLSCGARIPAARLQIVPFAATCTDCAASQEHR